MNKTLLKQIIDKIKEKPEQWQQAAWHGIIDDRKGDGIYIRPIEELHFCDTSHCVAGWAFALDNINNGRKWYETIDLPKIDTGKLSMDNIQFGPSPVMGSYWKQKGRELLELNYSQTEYLFDSDRTLEEIQTFYDTNGEVPEEEEDEDY